ncbi:MAG TPA: hypothetical protein VIJ23_13925 [Mycobacterium sp.]
MVTDVPARHIRAAGGKVLDVLDRAGLRGLATGTVAAVLAELYVDLRVLRPFQAGNDATIRMFLGLLADDAGYRIDWAAVPPAALTGACDSGDPDPLRVILQGAVHHIDTTGSGAGRKRREIHAWPTRSARSPTSSGHPPTPPRPADAAMCRTLSGSMRPSTPDPQEPNATVSDAGRRPPCRSCRAGPG